MKGIAGFYYVHVIELGIYECKAKGLFRKQNIKPLVGDNVTIDILSEEEKTGNIIDIQERKNALIRPAVANIDQALVIFASAKPNPNLNLLDRFLIMMERQGVSTVICFNKKDITEEEQISKLQRIYEHSGYTVLFLSVKENIGMEQLNAVLKNKTTVVAGPSGVGKSSLINYLQPKAEMETGTISKKIERGKHTTRHSEIFCVEGSTYLMDTPGFSTIYIDNMEKEELKEYFTEFEAYEPLCRFQGCDHIHEPQCGVKEALEKEDISRERYETYLNLYSELKDRKKY